MSTRGCGTVEGAHYCNHEVVGSLRYLSWKKKKDVLLAVISAATLSYMFIEKEEYHFYILLRNKEIPFSKKGKSM